MQSDPQDTFPQMTRLPVIMVITVLVLICMGFTVHHFLVVCNLLWSTRQELNLLVEISLNGFVVRCMIRYATGAQLGPGGEIRTPVYSLPKRVPDPLGYTRINWSEW
jgi:hypothetical protein